MVGYRKFLVVFLLGSSLFWFSAFSANAIFIFPVPKDPPQLEPVIIVPGLLESNNFNRIFYDKDGGKWGFTPYVDKLFNPLIQRLEAEGYEKDKTLFIAFNDWRASSVDSARDYLKPEIDLAKEKSGWGAVNLVAHSMGGLLSRAYIQGDNYDNDVDQLIMLGTPSAGSASAYSVWEGGNLPADWDYGRRLWIGRIEAALIKIRKTTPDRPNTFRTFFPSLKDLLPIDPYVVRGGNLLQPSDLHEKNQFLKDLRDTKGLLEDRGVTVTTIDGTGVSTLDHVPVAYGQTVDDLEKGRWRDGTADPNPSVNDSTAGDGTVLSASADDVGSTNIHLSGVKHEDLPAKAQNEVVKLLNHGEDGSAGYVPATVARAEVGIDVFSPVMPKVIGPNGEILTSDTNTFNDADFSWDPDIPDHVKMLTIIDPPVGKYQIILTGTGSGPYTVAISHAGDSSDITNQEFTGNAEVGSVNTYSFEITDDGQSIDITTPDNPSDSGDSGSSGSRGRGDEQDCCPGHDPSPTHKKHGKVLGATTSKIKKPRLEDLGPLNENFNIVFHRDPTFQEWTYWANRFMNDKPDWDALRGAMFWHLAHGKTIGA